MSPKLFIAFWFSLLAQVECKAKAKTIAAQPKHITEDPTALSSAWATQLSECRKKV